MGYADGYRGEQQTGAERLEEMAFGTRRSYFRDVGGHKDCSFFALLGVDPSGGETTAASY